MQIRYSTAPSVEIEFSGSQRDFRNLSELLYAGDGKILPQNGSAPDPYPNFARQLMVVRDPGVKVLIALTDQTIVIAGDVKWLNLLAQNMSGLAEEAQPPYHVHIEYFPGHFYLAPESVPLICCLHEEV